MSSRGLRPWLIPVVALAVHGPALFSPPPPVDLGFLDANALLRMPWGEFAAGLFSRRYFLLTGEATYQPLITLLHYVTQGFPLSFHWLVVAAHALNAWLLYVLAKRLGLGETASWLAGALLAAFPPATEAVAVPSFAGHVFGLTATLGCVICWMRALEGRSDAKGWLAGAYGFFIVGLLCKETVIVVPALAVLCWGSDVRRAPLRRVAPLWAAFPAVSCVYLVWRFAALPLPPAIPQPYRGDWMLSLGFYARMLLWPSPLCFEHAALSPGLTVFAGLFVMAGAAVALKPALFLCWAWIALELLPYLHVVPFAHTSPVADRYLYLAAAGFILLICQVLDNKRGRFALGALAVLWCGMTLARSVLFLDGDAVCEQTGACAPDSAPAQVMAGNSRLSRGDFQGAKESYERAVAIDPSQAVAWSDLGISLYRLGDANGAINAFQRSLKIADYPQVRWNLENATKGRKSATSAPARKRRAGRGLP